MFMLAEWGKNITASRDGQTAPCPHCGSEDTECGFQVINNKTRMGFGAIWCNSCRKGVYLSRIHIDDKKPIKVIPEDFDLWG